MPITGLAKKVSADYNLEKLYPAIAQKWHPTKNGSLLPSQVAPGSNKKVWWLCPKTCPQGCLHEYDRIIQDEVKGTGCPYCLSGGGRKICYHQSLEFLHPEIAKLWHPTLNGDLTPSQFSPGSKYKAWWLCPMTLPCGCPHEYDQPIFNKVNGVNCPYCSNGPLRKFCYHQSLEFLHPEIAKLWHPTLNGDLKPSQFTPGSDYKAWWLCPNTCSEGCLHEYEQIINDKANQGRSCPYCSTPVQKFCYHQSLEFLHLDLCKEWHPTLNGDLKPSQFTPGSKYRAWWLCPNTCPYGCLHEYDQTIDNRVRNGLACPYCCPTPRKICYHQSLEYLYPEIAKLWHPTLNGDLKPSQVTPGSGQKAWWLCPNTCSEGCLHEYDQIIGSKAIRGEGCPYCCSNGPKRICYHQSLEFLYPHLAKQWHPTLNGDLKPSQVTPGSGQKAWWLCVNNNIHEWASVINTRTNPNFPGGCPMCNKQGHSKVSQQWLRYMELYHNCKIQRHETGGEFRIDSSRSYNADGYCVETNTIYEFHGIFFHGDPRVYVSHATNILLGVTFGELYQRTLDKKAFCLSKGYNYVECWEYDWKCAILAVRIIQRKFRARRNSPAKTLPRISREPA